MARHQLTGGGVLRFNGAAWETGWHFCPRDSLNVIINQPTSLFFEAAMGSLWANREDTVMGCITVLPIISSFLFTRSMSDSYGRSSVEVFPVWKVVKGRLGPQKQTKSCSLEQTQPPRTSTNRSVPCLCDFLFLSSKDGPSRTGAIPSAPSLLSQSRPCGCLVPWNSRVRLEKE